MEEIDYNRPIEVYRNSETRSATVDPGWNGAGSPPIWTEGALFSVSENMLRRIGWRVRNVQVDG